MPQIVQDDVLIVGGGNAACAAALEASKNGVGVIIVDKGRLGRSGSSATSGGNYQTWLPEELGGHPDDTIEKFMENVVRGGGYLNNQVMTEIYAREGVDRVKELDGIGFPCAKTPDGKFRTALTFGMTYPRFLGIGGLESKGDWGEGHTVMKLLRKEVLHRGARMLEGVMVTRIFLADGRIAGAYGLNKYTGEEILFKVKAVILAAGGALGLYKYGSANFQTTGDGYRLGYDLGCPLINMEFEEFTIIPFAHGVPVFTGGSKPATSRGGRFVNNRGDYFMETYDSEKKDLTTRGRMVQSIYREMREGRGPVLLDATKVSAGKGGHLLKKLMHLGVNHTTEKIPLAPGIHTFLGGLAVESTCATSVPGLYSCGENAGQGNIYGADRVSGALTACHVLGYRSGKYAALYALEKEPLEPSQKQVQAERKRLRRQATGARTPSKLISEIKKCADNYLNVSRNRKGLEQAIGEMLRFQEDARQGLAVKTPYERVQALESENLALTGEMIARSALAREESRGQHFREDFPKMDTGWLKWIEIKKAPNEMALRTLPVPIDKYPVRPEMKETEHASEV